MRGSIQRWLLQKLLFTSRIIWIGFWHFHRSNTLLSFKLVEIIWIISQKLLSLQMAMATMGSISSLYPVSLPASVLHQFLISLFISHFLVSRQWLKMTMKLQADTPGFTATVSGLC